MDLEPTTHSYLRGYWQCLSDYGIWKDGKRSIGCLERDIKEAMEIKLKELGVDYVEFMKSINEFKE